ncbi:MAG: DUF1015 domain-containing protein [Candidatus Gastranaerophilales bacterium]|nr:DUF1015 domain-containing protein [Candidatus Gastranaerophilales bacterium]
MVELQPIKAIVYNQEKVNMDNTIAPPYDVIDEKYREDLLSRSAYNIVKLILPEGENKYENAHKIFEQWKNEKVLIPTEKPSVFYIIQKYTNEKGKFIERKGFIARNRIEDFSTKNILPHEYTMGGPKQDRLNLVTAAKAFFSQIFMVYNDKEMKIEKEILPKYLAKKPFIDVKDDLDVENIVYIIDDEKDIALIQKTLSDKTLLIADGHHRYETSMNYSNLHPENECAKYVMSYFTNAADENLIIYPTHRIVEKEIPSEEILSKVSKHYDVEKYTNKDEFLNKIEEENQKQITTGLILKNDDNYYVLKLKNGEEKAVDAPEVLQKLDLKVLHELILKGELGFTDEELMAQNGIKYEKKENVSFDSVKNGASACFIMAYPKMEDIINISQQGYRMPQKSTYFYPKLLSGIVINPLG